MTVDTSAPSVYAAFCETASRWPDREFLHIPASATQRYGGETFSCTYGQAHDQVQRLQAAYLRAGLGAGARVALLLENRPEAFFHWFALNGTGASVVPVNPDYRVSELSFLLEHSEACVAVSVPGRLADVRAAAQGLARAPVVIDAALVALGGLESIREPIEPQSPSRAEECAVLYTSGTTGRPKGCLLSNDYFIRLGLRYLNRKGHISLRPLCERILTPLPMFHMNAMASTTLAMTISGGCIVQLDRFHPTTWWEDVATSGATGIHYLGVMPAILLGLQPSPRERAHAVRFGTGANVEPRHHAAFEARFGFPLIEAWAMTETGSGAGIGAEEEPRHVGQRCFGRPAAGVELRLVDADGQEVATGEAGEMLVRRAGDQPRLGFFSGYLKDPQATEEAWADGWWHTGDMARRGPDGSLFFIDRKKNVIRRSGENISALEVEELLRGCPDVEDVAVTAARDEMRGDEVLACIVPRADIAGAGADVAQRIARWALSQAAYYKAPGWIAFLSRVPTTTTQKIDRAGLRALAAELLAGGKCFDTRALKRRDESASP